MTNPVLSNEVANRQVILWQYDHAPNLIALIDGFNKIATDTVTNFWDYFRDAVFNIQTADRFGLNVLGRLMGLPRPTVVIDGKTQEISDGLYRRLLLGRFFLFGMSPTVPNYNKYLSIIWGCLHSENFPVTYRKGGEEFEIPDCGNLAFMDRTEEGVRFLDVYDARFNTFLFTMQEFADRPGEYAYLDTASGIRDLAFAGTSPSPGNFPKTVCKMKAVDGRDMSMSFAPPESLA